MATLPTPEVAPAEALLATIGIKPVISRAVERVRVAQLEEAAAIGKQITKLARDTVNGELEQNYDAEFDYKSTLKDLARGFQPHQVEQMTAAFPAKYRAQAGAFVLLATSLAAELQKMYPVSTYQTVTGSINQLPSDLKFWKFVNILNVLDDPLTVFPLMASGALSRKEAAAVRLVYPTLSTAVDAALFQATVSAKAAKKSFELDPQTEIGVKAWFGQGPLPASLLKKAQANHAIAKQREAAAAPPPPRNQTNIIDTDGSPAERAVYANAG
jgi:hypothetical protein